MRPKELQPHSATQKNLTHVTLSNMKAHTTEFILNDCVYIKFQQRKKQIYVVRSQEHGTTREEGEYGQEKVFWGTGYCSVSQFSRGYMGVPIL